MLTRSTRPSGPVPYRVVEMQRLLVLTIVGFFAQLVDGSLGMAYGATSTSLLLVAGLAPATASASVHLAEVGTTLVAGTAHWRFGNVDWGIVARIGVPGAAGAFLGATALSSLSIEAARPVTAGILLAIGAWLLVRFTVRPPAAARPGGHGLRSRFLAPLGLVAGFIDASPSLAPSSSPRTSWSWRPGRQPSACPGGATGANAATTTRRRQPPPPPGRSHHPRPPVRPRPPRPLTTPPAACGPPFPRVGGSLGSVDARRTRDVRRGRSVIGEVEASTVRS